MSIVPENFETIEEAVMESSRGRWFLSEFASRLRARESAGVVDQMKSLEAAVSANHDAIMSRLAQALGQQAPAVTLASAPATAPELAPKHMKFFKQDEEIFEAAPQARIAAVPAAQAPAEPKGARLKITRMGEAAPKSPEPEAAAPVAAEAMQAEAQAEIMAPLPEAAPVQPATAAPAAEAAPKRRIVIIRHKPGEQIDVPLQNEMAATG